MQKTQTLKTQTPANSSYHLHHHHTNDSVLPACMVVLKSCITLKLHKPHTADYLSKGTTLYIYCSCIHFSTLPGHTPQCLWPRLPILSPWLILHKSTLKYPRTTRPEPQTQTPKTQTLANSSYHLHRHHTNDCITPPMHVCMYVCAQSCKSKLRKPYTPDSLSKCTKLNIHRISVLMATAPPYASSDSPLGEADQHHSPP